MVFADVAFDAKVVVAFAGAALRVGEVAALLLHLVGGLPGAQDHFTDAAHGLAVAAHHADGAHVVQHVLGGNGFFADAAFGRPGLPAMLASRWWHTIQHVDMLVERVDGVGMVGLVLDGRKFARPPPAECPA
jgi:hypothetical protein